MSTATRVTKAAALMAVTALILAGCGGGDSTDGQDGGSPAAQGDVVEVLGTDALAFEPEEFTATAGPITVELTSGEGVLHTFVVEVDGDDQMVVEAAAGATATGTIELEQGEYTFFCDVPGHRQAGMEGTLTVAEG